MMVNLVFLVGIDIEECACDEYGGGDDGGGNGGDCSLCGQSYVFGNDVICDGCVSCVCEGKC